MEARKKVMATFGFLVILISVLYLFTGWFSKTTGYGIENDPDIYLAKCLSDHGSKLYSSDNCPECKEQKRLFGSSAYNFVYTLDCSKDPSTCSNLKSIPAWHINGSFHYGVKSMNELRTLSGCE
jgi:hypothetical protein